MSSICIKFISSLVCPQAFNLSLSLREAIHLPLEDFRMDAVTWALIIIGIVIGIILYIISRNTDSTDDDELDDWDQQDQLEGDQV